MNVISELKTEEWQKRIGGLPEGFFIEVSIDSLYLRYNGPGFLDLTEPGGGKPKGESALILIRSVKDVSEESIQRTISKVRDDTERILIVLGRGREAGEIVSKDLIIGCPSCHVQCHDIKMERKGDGRFWTNDVCWSCGTKLPAVSLG